MRVQLKGVIEKDGWIKFIARDDDVITSAGYRIGPGPIEDCLMKHPSISMAAVIGKDDLLRTQIIKAFIVLNKGFKESDNLKLDIQSFVKKKLSAHEYPREVEVVKKLPVTSTGKILRRTIRKIADNVEYKVPPTIDDPAILTEIKEDLINNNLLKN